jgi:nucleotide-binding universal stress UspA family protein
MERGAQDGSRGDGRPTAASSIRQILVPSDLSAEADHALEHAAQLADRFDASLLLYHAVPLLDHSHAHWAFAHGPQIWAQCEREGRLALELRAARLSRPVQLRVERAASVSAALLAWIRETQPDLVVMGTHGRRGLEHVLLGSVTEKVFQISHKPVLCVRRTKHAGGHPYARILVPTDLSHASRHAFPLAAAFAKAFASEIVVVHVAPVAGGGFLAGSLAPARVLSPSEAELWAACRDDFAGLEVTAQVHTGAVWDRIVHTARVEEIDLIVMATRGQDSLAERVMGSNTGRVMRYAPCPVLVI